MRFRTALNQRRCHDRARQAQKAAVNVREYTGLFGHECGEHAQPMRIQLVQKLFRSAQYCYSGAGCGGRKSPLTETQRGEKRMAKFKMEASLYHNKAEDVHAIEEGVYVVEAKNEADAAGKLQDMLEGVAEDGFVVEPASEEDVVKFNSRVDLMKAARETHAKYALTQSESRLLEKAKSLYPVPPPSPSEIRAQFHCSIASAKKIHDALVMAEKWREFKQRQQRLGCD
jgi:hypothetical protein